MLKARAYLEKLCLDNETGNFPQPQVLRAVAEYQMKDIAPVGPMLSGAEAQPRRVFVETPRPAEQRRRAERVALLRPADAPGGPPKEESGAAKKGLQLQRQP